MTSSLTLIKQRTGKQIGGAVLYLDVLSPEGSLEEIKAALPELVKPHLGEYRFIQVQVYRQRSDIRVNGWVAKATYDKRQGKKLFVDLSNEPSVRRELMR